MMEIKRMSITLGLKDTVTKIRMSEMTTRIAPCLYYWVIILLFQWWYKCYVVLFSNAYGIQDVICKSEKSLNSNYSSKLEFRTRTGEGYDTILWSIIYMTIKSANVRYRMIMAVICGNNSQNGPFVFQLF